MLKQETIEAVQQVARIEEVIGEFITLKRKGQNLWACCPFHHERTPSFAVSPGKGLYKCFGCEVAGDAISFVKAIQGVSFVEAVKHIARKYNIPIQETEAVRSEDALRFQHEKDSLYILMKFAHRYYVDNLLNHPEGERIGHSYLRERGIDDSIIQQFEIGYSLDQWTNFLEYSQQQGFSTEMLEKAGLVVRNQEKIYDRFRGRIMLPIHNLAGEVIAFAARMVGASDDQPKYINSPDTPIYQKGDMLYGLDKAKQAMRQTGHCFLVEGYMDVMALHKAEIPQVVASCGTSLTQTQVERMGRFATCIKVLFDGDTAGIQAALRGMDKILESGLDVKAILLPAGEDPDSYVKKHGPEALRVYLKENEQDFINFKTKLLLEQAGDDLIKRKEVVRQVVQSISLVPDAVLRSLLLQRASKLLSIDEEILAHEQDKLRHQTQQTSKNYKSTAELHLTVKNGKVAPFNWNDLIHAYEKESVRLLLHYGSMVLENDQTMAAYLLQELNDVVFRHPVYKYMREVYEAQLAQGKSVTLQYFIAHPDEPIRQAAIDLSISPYTISEGWNTVHKINIPHEMDDPHKAIYGNVLRLKLKIIHQLLEENIFILKNNPSSEEEEQMLQVHTTLRGIEKQIAKQLSIVVLR